MAILKDEDDAKDAVQEVFVKIYLGIEKFKKMEGASFSSWSYKILLNHCFSVYKKKKYEQSLTHKLDLDEMADIFPSERDSEHFENKLTFNALLSAISKLPNILRKVTVMHFIEGKPQKFIAKQEGISLGAVRARIFRAKDKLRAESESFRLDII
jgi:RNA polymerase sigma-70 factor (ECF subfamily)